MKKLDTTWRDWIADGLRRGCRQADLRDVMTSHGFDSQYAEAAIDVVKSMPHHKADPIKIVDAPVIDVGDRQANVVMIMQDPNIAIIDNFLSPDECKQIIEMSGPSLARSTVANREQHTDDVSDIRTSDGTHFYRNQFPLIGVIDERIARLTSIPATHGESLQILRYNIDGKYEPHHDWFDPNDSSTPSRIASGGQRIATVVLYLNDVEQGGDTAFPSLKLQVKPKTGRALFFEYQNNDERCKHGGSPVKQGTKWIATKWLRVSPL